MNKKFKFIISNDTQKFLTKSYKMSELINIDESKIIANITPKEDFKIIDTIQHLYTDCEGVEIYEYDMILIDGELNYIEFHKGLSCYVFRKYDNDFMTLKLLEYDLDGIELISNLKLEMECE